MYQQIDSSIFALHINTLYCTWKVESALSFWELIIETIFMCSNFNRLIFNIGSEFSIGINAFVFGKQMPN